MYTRTLLDSEIFNDKIAEFELRIKRLENAIDGLLKNFVSLNEDVNSEEKH